MIMKKSLLVFSVNFPMKWKKCEEDKSFQKCGIQTVPSIAMSKTAWSRLTKYRNVSTGTPSRLFTSLLALLTHSLAPSCLLCSRAPLRSLTHFWACEKVNDQMDILAVFLSVWNHSAASENVFGKYKEDCRRKNSDEENSGKYFEVRRNANEGKI